MKKPLTKKFLILLLCVSAVFGTCKFEYDSRVSDFVPVEEITGVPTGGVKGYEITLNRTVSPPEATNKTIVWSIADDGGTGSTLDRNKLTAVEIGTVTVKAFIKDGKAPGVDYTQEFKIAILNEYIAVNAIQGIPSKIPVGTFKLEGTVKPSNAVKKTIIWELKEAGLTGAVLDGDILTTTTRGEALTVTALVENGAGPDTDYRQDFEIIVSPLSVRWITGVATGCLVGNYTLFGKVYPSDASFKNITWEVRSAGGTGAVINDSVLTTSSSGTVKVIAVVKDGIDFDYDYFQSFDIEIADTFVPVVSIVDDISGEYSIEDIISWGLLDLPNGGVDPWDATNQTIIWELKSADETGAVIIGNVFMDSYGVEYYSDILTTLRPGTITITAIVKDGTAPGEDYTQDFTMVITE